MVIHHWQNQNVKVSGVDDMVLLPKVTVEAIMENLRKRYMDDYIYTCIGPVLVSINPFKPMPYFSENEVQIYQGSAPYENPPHIYGLADEMYRNMLVDAESQCVIISGESGAGKTVAAKYIMAYVSLISGGGGQVQRVKDIMLKSNPLLEAFGNAKTIRNNNSSRFGKYVEIQFGDGGQPIGGKISNFLLEKSRVVRHNSAERNFHVFYQLVAGANEQMKLEFGLRHELDGCDYLMNRDGNMTGISDHGNINDAKDFQDILQALSVMSIDETQVSDILRLVAGILHIGCIKFQEDGNYSQISDSSALELPSRLFGVVAQRLAHKLTSREFESKWGSKSESVDVTLNIAQALYTRDALAKDIYARLFDYLVKRVNLAMAIVGDAFQIAILDIYGFEIFDTNGFEQLCINFVNEKLQQIFIELTLKTEQEEYIVENIKWTPINYSNNTVVLKLLEDKRPPGLFLILDDICATLHGGSIAADSDFRKKLNSTWSNHAHLQSTSDGFAILHYAGQVVYSVDGFCEKNRDILFPDLIELMQSSTNQLVNELYPHNKDLNTNTKTMLRTINRTTTVGSKIRNQASRLIAQLIKCMPHYIRCIKPNETKKPHDWDALRVKHQVEYLGLKENIRVRRAGFAYRRTFAKFLHRYSILMPKIQHISNNNVIYRVKTIMSNTHIDDKQYQLGTTKVFIKAPESVFMLEEARNRKYNYHARIIQQAFKKYIAQKQQNSKKQAATDLLYGQKQRRRASLDRYFIGDYIGLDGRPGITRLLGRGEKVIFAEVVKKYDRRFKMCRRDLVLTESCLYLIGRVKKIMKKGPKVVVVGDERTTCEEIIKRKLTFNQISHVSMSKLQDDFVIIHAKEGYSSLLQSLFKTEFVAILSKKYLDKLGHSLNIRFNNTLEFKVKKGGWGGGGTRQLQFSLIEEYGNNEITKTSGKILNVTIGPGIPSTSRPKYSSGYSKSSQLRPTSNNHIAQFIDDPNNYCSSRITALDCFYENMNVTTVTKQQPNTLIMPTRPKLISNELFSVENCANLTSSRSSQLSLNRPIINFVISQYNNTKIRSLSSTTTLDRVRTNPGSSLHLGLSRPPPPPSHPAPPNQPMVHSAYGIANNKLFIIHRNNENNNCISNNQPANVLNDPNRRLATTLHAKKTKRNKQLKLEPSRPPLLPFSNLPKVKALYDYNPQDLDELELKEGDIVELLKEHEGGWWQGKLKGKTGLFPSNYVEKIS